MTTQQQSLSRTAELELQRSWIAAEVLGQKVTVGDLSDAFDRVKPKPNWEMPICAEFTTSTDVDESAREVAMIREAVVHFCGCVPEIRHQGNFRFLCTAVGYYEAVGP